MTALVDFTPAPQAPGRPTSESRFAGGGDTWRRELETALAYGWFHGPIQQHPVGPSPAAEVAAWPGPTDHGSNRTAGASPVGGRCAASMPDAGFGQHQPLQPSVPAVGVARPGTLCAGPVRELVPQGALPSPGHAPSLPAASCNGPANLADAPEPMERPASICRWAPADRHAEAARVHVEHGPDGASVWLGLDGDRATVAARVGAILSELRRSPGGTHRIAHVVCNGTTLFSDAEQPHPSPTPLPREKSWP